MQPTRRQFLATSAAVGTGLFAGCSWMADPGPSDEMRQFTSWVPEAGAVVPRADTIRFTAVSPAEIHSNKSDFHPGYYRQLQSSYRTGIEWASLTMELDIRGGTVFTGEFDAATVRSELTSETAGPASRYTQIDSPGSFDIFIREQHGVSPDTATRAYAVGDNTILRTRSVGQRSHRTFRSAVEVARTLIAVGTKGTNRARDATNAFATLATRLHGTFIAGQTRQDAVSSAQASISKGLFEGLLASGWAAKVNGSKTKQKAVFVFETATDLTKDALHAYVERTDTGGRRWAYTSNITVTTTGNVGIITGTIDTYDLGRRDPAREPFTEG